MNSDHDLKRVRTLLADRDYIGALAIIDRILSSYPANAQCWFLLGACRHALGNRRTAIDAFHRAIALAPDDSIAFNALAAVLADQGQLTAALDAANRSAALNPDDASTLFNRGVVLERMGQLQAALEAYDQALVASPQFALALLNRGAVLMLLGRFVDAVENNRRLVSLQPGSADAHFNLAEALLGLGQGHEALAACDGAIAIDPLHAKAHIDRALALSDLGRIDEARLAFAAAESISPGAIKAYICTVAPSDASLDRSFDPRLVFLYRSYERLMRCDWSTRDAYVVQLAELVLETGRSDRRMLDLPLAYHCLTVPVPPEARSGVATALGQRYADAVAQVGSRFSYPERAETLRIGYLSADYCEHLNAYLTLPLFRLHDRRAFEVIAYSIGPDDASAARIRVREHADRFVDLRNSSDLDAARLINQDGVHVLVDLTGYTQNCRPGIGAFRPAPVQVSYLGFPGTMGAPWIDYRLTDRVSTPPDQVPEWTESLVYLPDTFFIYDRFESLARREMTRATYGLPEDAFVFCAFNSYYKIEPEIFRVWLDILKAVPAGVLWLSGQNESAMANLRREAQRQDVSAERLIFVAIEPRDDYRQRYCLADLFLDTPIFNAMTTACDALAAGLPVLTIAGTRFASRVAASLLTAARFDEGIAKSPEEYRRRAIDWGNSPSMLAELRRRRLSDPLTTPLFDTESRVRQLESAFQEMWRRYNLGLAPESFDVIARKPAWRSRWH